MALPIRPTLPRPAPRRPRPRYRRCGARRRYANWPLAPASLRRTNSSLRGSSLCTPYRVMLPQRYTAMRTGSLFRPGGECIRESPIAGRAFFHGQDGAAAIVIDDRDIEPRLILEQLDIALHVGIDRGQADQEEAVGDLDRESGERNAAGLLGILHQNAGHIGNAAAG